MVISLKLLISKAQFQVRKGKKKRFIKRFYLMITNPVRTVNLSKKPTEWSWGKPSTFMEEMPTSYKCQKDRKSMSVKSLDCQKDTLLATLALTLWDTQGNCLSLGIASFITVDVIKLIFCRLLGYHYLKVVKCWYPQYSHERQSN